MPVSCWICFILRLAHYHLSDGLLILTLESCVLHPSVECCRLWCVSSSPWRHDTSSVVLCLVFFTLAPLWLVYTAFIRVSVSSRIQEFIQFCSHPTCFSLISVKLENCGFLTCRGRSTNCRCTSPLFTPKKLNIQNKSFKLKIWRISSTMNTFMKNLHFAATYVCTLIFTCAGG